MRIELALACWLISASAWGAEPLVDEFLPRVVKVMGLPMTRKVTVKRVSRVEAEQILRREVDVKAAARLGEALVAIGLLPAGTRLEDLAPDFNQQNVAGFYDLREHTLFLIADQPDEALRPIIAHELAHAVQDANVDLLSKMKGSEDATLAFTAVLEGQAQATAALVMAGWLEDHHVAVEGMAGLLSDTTARSAAEAADQAPVPWLGLQLRFPYVAGRALIEASATADDPIARGLLQRPPASTAEVMMPSRLAAPLAGDLQLTRLLPGARASVTTTLGRAQLELLGGGLGEGWRGDRLESVHVGRRLVTVWSVAFATEAQAIAFAEVVKGEREGAVVALLVGTRNEAVKKRALRAFVR
ncbi:MAG: hypothetical protein Q8N23_29815 [Archangium sp.]|nr:hypothetical protein [Archangium sp.]MDP3575585.1 hypothetical protein [Archangium sp.]